MTERERASSEEGRWWIAAAALGLVAALPFLVLRYLPLVDLPLHQLETAIWAEPAGAPTGFAHWYESAGWSLPYWLPTVLAGLAAPLLGAEAATRAVIALYALGLPLAGGFAARASGRSGWWGLLLVPFVLEFNLAYGFVAYCLGGMLLLLAIGAALRAESGGRGWLLLEAAAALAIGWTHPQIAVAVVGWCAGLALLNRGGRRRLAVFAASLPALLPSALWFAHPDQAATAFGSPPEFAGFGELLRDLPGFSVDVFPGPVEELLALAALGLVAATWFRQRRPALRDARFALAAAGFLVLYFVTPFSWNGQAVCQRMPYLALLCLPLLPPVGVAPGRGARVALVVVALAGALNTGLALFGFDRETAPALDRLADELPEGARLAYAGYDVHSAWVHAPAYLHAGAWLTLRRGGVYAFHFNRLVSRYRDVVPADQTMVQKELYYSRKLRDTGRPPVVRRDQLAFWDAILIRWPPHMDPILPVAVQPPEIAGLDQAGPWGLLRLRPP
jgi:hypothetical protein